MVISLGFVSFILLNFIMFAEYMEGHLYIAAILLLMAGLNLIILTFVCKKIEV